MNRLPTLPQFRLWCAAALLALLVTVTACNHNRSLELENVFAYVSNGRSDTVSVIDVSRMAVVRTIGVGRNPSGIAASPT
ncbi:MAG TPA: hypothetical protein VII81_14045, partial [Terriglobales bacterium]